MDVVLRCAALHLDSRPHTARYCSTEETRQQRLSFAGDRMWWWWW